MMSALAPRPSSFALRDVMVLDEVGGFDGPTDVVVRDGVVAALGRNARLEAGTDHDFSGLWIMPGMFDCHLHTVATSLDTMELLRTPLSQRILEAGSILRRTLEAGVTFVRDAGGADAGFKRALELGFTTGPRLQVAVTFLSQTGGHFDGFLAGPALEASANYQIPDYPGRPEHLVDGPADMVRAVRRLLRAGADWIKLATTGGIMSAHDEGPGAELTREEIEAAVAEAGRRGRGVMVHCFGGEGLRNSVLAGVRSIEHGLLLTEEDARLMAERGCWLVPTLSAVKDLLRRASEGGLPDFAARKLEAVQPRVGEAVQIARDLGVRIALGTDFITREQHGRNLEEIAHVVDAGLPVEQALLAATRGGAELCGVADRYGQIAPGFVFDAIVLDSDPGDLAFARSGAVGGVFKGGTAVLPHPRLGHMAGDDRAQVVPAPL
jgi:imidazolonepropionase-like amidohydrolase